MKIIILFAILTFAVADVDYYETPNDNYDVDALIDNVPLLQSFVDCVKETGPCSDLGAGYKTFMSEAIKDACKRCNPAQKHLYRRILEVIKQVLPEEYILFKQKLDPENKYFGALEKEISQY